ncbi:MAG: tripartite tricarboxylate transporter substrate binding protein [Thermodesulfobacteriota bacterium]
MKANRIKKRAKFIYCLIAILGIIFLSTAATPESVWAQEKYPAKPITLLIGYPAGGSVDIMARPFANAAGKTLGQPIVIMNKPGGGSSVAVASLKNEAPDGYTIGLLITGAIMSQHMRKVPYDTAKDFTPIMQYAVFSYGLVVRSDSPWKNFKEFMDYAKNNPGKIRYSTSGPGTPQHLVMERLALKEKINWTHIPFEGGPPAITALLGSHVEAASQATEWKKQVQSGHLRLLAVYGEKRMIDFPEVPTLVELGYPIVASSLGGIIGPKGLSPQTVETIRGAFKEAMDDPDYVKIGRQMDMTPVYRGPQEFAKHLEEINEEVGVLIRSLGLRKE